MRSPRRSKLEVFVDVLEAILDGYNRPTQIMYKANLSWLSLKRIIGHLEASHLIEAEADGNSRVWKVTKKGFDVIYELENLQKQLASEPSEALFKMPLLRPAMKNP